MTTEHTTPQRVNVLGVGINGLNLPAAVELMESAVRDGKRGYVCVTDVRAIIEAQDDPAYLHVLNNSFLTVPDGRPSVWVGRAQGFSQMDQVAGPDLILEFCKLSSEKGYSQFFYGGAPGVAEGLKEVLCARYPGLNVVGTYTPPFRPLSREEIEQFAETLARLKPDVTWIGLGAPKQELFMAQYVNRLETTLMVGVGAAFDMHTGRINDAPQWVKRMGCAWVHRLAQEPRRLWKRYLKANPRFTWGITMQLLGLKNTASKLAIDSCQRRAEMSELPTLSNIYHTERSGIYARVSFSPNWDSTAKVAFKRFLDVLISAAALVLLSPLYLALGIAVTLTSAGGMLYHWPVVGKGGKPFTGYKFRSMYANADRMKAQLESKNEMSGPVFKLTNDPRVTKVGAWMRRYSLDELPQLYSVLKGDMSLVGPRPPLVSEYARFTEYQKQKLAVKPGITCFWQVSGRNEIKDFDEWVRLDLDYIRSWTPMLDITILAKTVGEIIAGSGK